MSLSLVHSRALLGLEARPVQVEVHLANGLPSFTLVGLADTEVKEARERVRSAIANAGLEFPSNKRITVNLAPADLPKDSGRFDLPIALGILAASGQIDGARLTGWEFAGELSLGGELRPVRGALAMSLALHQAAGQATGLPAKLVMPHGSAEEAALVPQAQVYRARHLLDVVAHFRPEGASGSDASAPEPPPDDGGWARLAPTPLGLAPRYPDLADVKGQAAARRALEIAAAGGHSLLMVGPPGSGKSMLAQRFAGLLPPMNTEQALESAAVASLAGRFDLTRWGERPTCAPHHSASSTATPSAARPRPCKTRDRGPPSPGAGARAASNRAGRVGTRPRASAPSRSAEASTRNPVLSPIPALSCAHRFIITDPRHLRARNLARRARLPCAPPRASVRPPQPPG
jgi:magnesium chelatase family protein